MKIWRLRESWEEISPGVYRQILAPDYSMMLMIVRIQPNSTVQLHSHRNVQAGMLIKGKLMFKTERGGIELSEGDSYYIEADELHGVHNSENIEAIALDIFMPRRDDYLLGARQADVEI